MSDASATVDDAARWADVLLQRTYRGPGDTVEAATYRAEQKYGIPAQTFWALRYRPNASGKKRDCGMNWNWLKRFKEARLWRLLSATRKLSSERREIERERRGK